MYLFCESPIETTRYLEVGVHIPQRHLTISDQQELGFKELKFQITSELGEIF
jgi:hypothetical protein